MAEKRTAIIIGSLVIVAVVLMAGWVLTAPETTPDSLTEITNPTDVQNAVLLDGVDLRDWDLTALRRNFAVVLQEVFLFSGTIEGNIRLDKQTLAPSNAAPRSRP